MSNNYIRDWDTFWLGMAEHVSLKSKDPSLKVGAVIVTTANDLVSIGWNGFPRGVRELEIINNWPPNATPIPPAFLGPGLDPGRWERRPEKYRWVVHAEQNAVLNAGRLGRSVNGCRIYINGGVAVCSECVKAIIQGGIHEIVGLPPRNRSVGLGTHWFSGEIEDAMLAEAGVARRVVEL